MVTKWEYTRDHEILRILHGAKAIANGFYKLNGFIVLPYPQFHSHGRIVPFPDLPYLNIPRFWEKAAKIDIKNLPSDNFKIDPVLISQVGKLCEKVDFPTPDFSQTQKIWSKYETQIIKTIYSLIPSKKDSISKIHVWPTLFDTTTSFNICTTSPQDIYIWLRQDQGIAAIIEAILTSITRNDVYENLDGIWQESEFLVDWLITYSPLNTIIKQADPNWKSNLTIKNTRSKQDGSLTEKSALFMDKLGIPSINHTTISSINFSPREKEIIDLLSSVSPHAVSNDQIGNILFRQNPDDYSLFAISKTIQRLRDKLEQNGISGSFIQTKRGEGYLLIA